MASLLRMAVWCTVALLLAVAVTLQGCGSAATTTTTTKAPAVTTTAAAVAHHELPHHKLEADSTVFLGMVEKSMAYSQMTKSGGEFLVSPVKGSWREVGQRNLGAVQELSGLLAETMQGLQITPALMAKLSQKMMSYYAPKVSCRSGKNSAFEVDLKDVSVAQCFMAMGRLGSNLMWLNFVPKNTAIDPASGGNTILVYSVLDLVGEASTGEHVPGTHVHGMVTNSRYLFNEDGKIEFMESEFDSGILQADNYMVLDYDRMQQSESRSASNIADVNLVANPIAGDWAGVGEKNIETLQRINYIAKEIQGKQATQSLMAKMSEQMMAFFAPKMSCRFWKMSAMAGDLDNVPVSKCFAEMGRFGSYTKHFVMENAAVDPASGGKTILSYSSVDSAGLTSSGEEVPGTIVHGIPFNYRWKFNDEGRVYFMQQEADSTVFLGMAEKAMAYSQMKKSGVEFLASSDSFSLAATANCFLAMACALLASALVTLWFRLDRRGPVLLEQASF